MNSRVMRPAIANRWRFGRRRGLLGRLGIRMKRLGIKPVGEGDYLVASTAIVPKQCTSPSI